MIRYSGSKKRLLKFLPPPPPQTSLVLEPFAGSLAYSMHYRPVAIQAGDANPLVRGLWDWLRGPATEERLTFLEEIGRASCRERV